MTADQIIEGADGWLFLKEGTNRSRSYLTGADRISSESQHAWLRALKTRQSLFPGCLHVVCPEKLAVFHQFTDVRLDESRFVFALHRLGGLVYPVEELKAGLDGRETYSKSDTHFNDVGAFVTARKILEEFGVSWNFSPEWSVQNIKGDLGIKYSPARMSGKYVLANPWPVKLQQNNLTNRGRIMHFLNEQADEGKLLIFGDSFCGINLARMLSGGFSEVLFIHSLSVDYRIVAMFEPDHILFELAERFLRDPPQDGQGLERILIDKAIAGQADEVRDWRRDGQCPLRNYVNWENVDFVLSRLETI